MAQPADQAHATDDFDDAIDQLRADYDMTPYTSNSFPQSAPGQLAAIAHLFGLETPEVSSARVLEIGCAAGGNLIPFAAAHPQAHTVGIDLSQVQVDQGRTRAQALGLNNLELLAGDIARMNLAALGQFEFIVAHGVYSWVPAAVQEGRRRPVQRPDRIQAPRNRFRGFLPVARRTFNEPCYFYEMLGRAGAHGLTYQAEAHPETMLPANFGPKVAEYLGDSVAVSKCWWMRCMRVLSPRDSIPAPTSPTTLTT
jgi:SAM-dependent methyltransferase